VQNIEEVLKWKVNWSKRIETVCDVVQNCQEEKNANKIESGNIDILGTEV
jgi:hypothetical protein